jgi:predicted nicotinamide N-methyase
LSLRPGDRRRFILANTALGRARLAPEICLYLASDLTPLWHQTETFLQTQNISPPFWAFAWPGSEALARHLLDHPALVRGRRVLDFAAGCGLGGIACALASAAAVTAAEIDPLACAAIALNAEANNVDIEIREGEVVGETGDWEVIIAGDIFYEAPMTRHVLPWLRGQARQATVFVADPGRAYAPRDGLTEITRMSVPTSLELEDKPSREVVIFQLLPR